MNPSAGALSEGLSGMANVFVDPASTARRVPARLFWLWPLLVLCIGYGILGRLLAPTIARVTDNSFAQSGMSGDQLERARSVAHTMQSIMIPAGPVFLIATLALLALLVSGMYSMMGVKTRFRNIFSLLAVCELILFLQRIAGYIVVRAKGDEIQLPEQISPPFGLDIFTPNVHGAALAFLNFFSIFEIWYIVILVFALAYLTGSSRTKAFVASLPAWILPLLFRLLGAAFQKGPAT